MIGTALSPAEIELGSSVTHALLEAEVPLNGAYWLYASESAEWRLCFVLADFDKHGPAAAYARIQRVFSTIPSAANLPLRRLFLVGLRDPVYRALRSAFKVQIGSTVRVSNNLLNGTLIEDAFLYLIR